MTTTTTRLLTFFDPDDKHEWCDTRFDKRIFIRFTDSPLCFTHISNHMVNPEMDVHLFFPDAHIELIMTGPPEVSDTLKYIYCHNQTSIDSIKTTYGRRVAHKLFIHDHLEFEIGHAQVALLFSLGKTLPESTERNEIMSAAMQQLEGLRHILKQNMTDQQSEEVIERH